MAENDYNEIYEKARANFDEIDEENVATIKAFAKFDNTEDIIATLQENGSGEKIPFNEGVIESATMLALDIAKKEAASYLTIYDKMVKLMADIDTGSAKIELHKKYLRNEKAKIDFIIAVKEYMTQFLDYERMTIIHGRKSHNRLMSEACENFNADTVQIGNLFELLLRETTNKATKKAYKELYNQTYLTEIKEKEEKFKREKNRVNLNTATLINSNYWRIEGVKVIYTVFYKNVSEVFGRDVEEFDIPKEFDENINEDSEEYDEETAQEEVVEEVVEEKKEEKKKELPRMPFETHGSLDIELDEMDRDEEDEDEAFKNFKNINKKSKKSVEETEDDDEEVELIMPSKVTFDDEDDEEEIDFDDDDDSIDDVEIQDDYDDEDYDEEDYEDEEAIDFDEEDDEDDDEINFDDDEEESIVEIKTKKSSKRIEIPEDESDEIKELLRKKIQSYDDLVRKFMKAYYKDAAEYIYAYYEILRDRYAYYQNIVDTTSGGIYGDIDKEGLWTQPVIEKIDAEFDKALAVIEQYRTTNPDMYETLKNRIMKERLSPMYIKLAILSSAYSAQEIAEIKAEFKYYVNLFKLTEIAEGSEFGGFLD
jgi:hypothetical protein